MPHKPIWDWLGFRSGLGLPVTDVYKCKMYIVHHLFVHTVAVTAIFMEATETDVFRIYDLVIKREIYNSYAS